jgi:hypothetical protein
VTDERECGGGGGLLQDVERGACDRLCLAVGEPAGEVKCLACEVAGELEGFLTEGACGLFRGVEVQDRCLDGGCAVRCAGRGAGVRACGLGWERAGGLSGVAVMVGVVFVAVLAPSLSWAVTVRRVVCPARGPGRAARPRRRQADRPHRQARLPSSRSPDLLTLPAVATFRRIRLMWRRICRQTS